MGPIPRVSEPSFSRVGQRAAQEAEAAAVASPGKELEAVTEKQVQEMRTWVRAHSLQEGQGGGEMGGV